jgi:hypothetical protein
MPGLRQNCLVSTKYPAHVHTVTFEWRTARNQKRRRYRRELKVGNNNLVWGRKNGRKKCEKAVFVVDVWAGCAAACYEGCSGLIPVLARPKISLEKVSIVFAIFFSRAADWQNATLFRKSRNLRQSAVWEKEIEKEFGNNSRTSPLASSQKIGLWT